MSIRCLGALSLSLSILLAACAPPSPAPPQVNIDAEKAAIAAFGETYVQRFRDKDAVGLAGLYTMDAVRVVAGQAPNRGGDAITAAIQAGFDNGNQSIAAQPDEVIVAENGRTAVVYGTYEVDLTPPAGEPMKRSGNFMNTLTKDTDGSWKITRSLVAPVVPVPAPPPAAK